MNSENTQPKKIIRPRRQNQRTAWMIAAASVLVVAAVFVFAVYPVLYNPNTLFENQPVQTPPAQTPAPLQNNELLKPEPTPIPTPEPDYLLELEKLADFSEMKNVFNILLIGVDYADERNDNKKEYVNKDFNSDVMMLMAVNFDEKKVDLISVPRDTYAKIANAEGKYKLNFSLTLGGGICDEGFMNVCKSVEWVLGGVPVNYYIAVTMPMLKQVVDVVGGVDFDVDVDYKIQSRVYKKGMQHLNGQGVLDYCRVRKNMEQAGDANRVNRQKKMMLKVYETIRTNTELKDVPELIRVLNENVYTNLDFSQLAALAYFGNGLDLSKVEMHSMSGTSCMIYNFAYVCTDQNKRVKLIKQIYNVDVPKREEYTADYARLEWAQWQARELVPRINEALIGEYEDYMVRNAVDNLEYIASSSEDYAEISAAVNELIEAVKMSGIKVSTKVDVYDDTTQVRMKE